MGERGATGGAWGARDDASWWSGASGELQHQQQINEEIARSTASSTHQLYSYKMTGGFSNNSGENQTPNFDYRLMTSTNSREETPQQSWWFASGSDQHQSSSPTPQNQSSPESDQSNQQANGLQNHQNLQVQEQSQIQQHTQIQQHNQLQQQLQQQQSLQQALQQQTQNLQQSLQQQTLQQMLQQQHQQPQQSQTQQQQQQQQQQRDQAIDQQNPQQNLQIQVSQAQAQALVQAQAVLQQQVAQTLQQQQSLHDHIQAVQQQQIQAALQRQSANLQELQQQAQQQQALLTQTTVTKTRMPRARAYNKPRGRMTAYAFFVQTCREEHKKKHPEENVVFAAFSKKCAERWNTMSEKEKLRFHEMAEQDRKRYDIEMQSYVPPKEIKMRGRKRQQPKDPNAPKRSLSAFFWFCNDERSKVKANNPEYTIGDIAKELGRRWAAVDATTKSKYEALSEQDKARYDKEMTAYKKGPLALNLVQQQQVQQEMEEDVGEYEVEDEYK